MVAVLVHTITPTGKRAFGYRPTSIATNPVIFVDNETGAESCAVRFNVVVWG